VNSDEAGFAGGNKTECGPNSGEATFAGARQKNPLVPITRSLADFLVICLSGRDFKNEKSFQSVILYILEEGWMLKLPVTVWIVLF
jgi:hypothetical protein